MTTQITVLGLGQIGASIGLALADKKDEILRVGNDRTPDVARRAEKIGAFDKIIQNLHQAVENAGVVILCLPVDEIEPTMQVIAEDLKPGSVVVDTSPLKIAVAERVVKLLGPDRHFVSMLPSLNPAYLEETLPGIDGAHADLFHKALMVITSPPTTESGAIKLATDLSILLGGKPFFADPYESDGLTAASHILPRLQAAAMVNATMSQPGWREGRKIAGQLYTQATLPAREMDEFKSFGQAALMNRENVLRVLDDYIRSLMTLRGMIEAEETEALSSFLEQARQNRENWMKERKTANWEPTQATPTLSTGQMLGQLVGIRPREKKK